MRDKVGQGALGEYSSLEYLLAQSTSDHDHGTYAQLNMNNTGLNTQVNTHIFASKLGSTKDGTTPILSSTSTLLLPPTQMPEVAFQN